MLYPSEDAEMQDWKMWHKTAEGGKCRNGKRRQKGMERRMSNYFCGTTLRLNRWPSTASELVISQFHHA